MKRNILIWIYFLCFWTGLIALFYRHRRRRALVISYHNILTDGLYDSSLHLGVSHRWSEFVRQVDIIRRRFRLSTELHGKPGTCVLTFDDGYANNVLAADHLKSIGARGVFFVPVEPLATHRTMAIDRVMLWFSYAPPGTYNFSSHVIELTAGNRGDAYSKFYAWLLAHPAEWHGVPELLDRASPFSTLPVDAEMLRQRFQPMTAADIRRLLDDGHVIGCHSWDHRPLAALGDDEIEADFKSCSPAKAEFGMHYYCYPFGGPNEVDARARRACERAGYECAVTNVSSDLEEGPDRFALPRDYIPQESNRYVIEAKLSGLEAAIKGMIGG